MKHRNFTPKKLHSTSSVCYYCYKVYVFCWPETNRLLEISSAKMDLFEIGRELKFGVCSHGKPHASPHTARKGERFYGREGRGVEEVGRALVNRVHAFLLAESLPGKKRSLLPVGFCYCHRTWELPLLVSWLYVIEFSEY